MPINTTQIVHIVFLVAALLSTANISPAQNITAAEIRKAFADAGSLASEGLSTLDTGKLFAKALSVEDKRDLAVIGIIGLDSPIEEGLKGFDQAISRQRKKTGRSFGTFGSTPKLEDFRSLRLDKNEIEDIKRCAVGKCKLRLSANMIERFRDEIDWTAKDYKIKVNRLYRQMLVDYVADYLKRGDDALIEYQHKRVAISLKDETKSLQKKLLLINEIAPEFSEYLEEFPNGELSNVENAIRWAMIKVVNKPVLIINHISTYRKKEKGVSQILVVSKQIYTNHRFDASLGLTVLASFPEDDPNFTYFLYTTTARVSALKGALGKLVRGTAEDKAIDTLRVVLKDTKRYAKTPLLAETDPTLPEDEGILEWLYGSKVLMLGILVLVGIASFRVFRFRRLDGG